ncbi:MAG: cation:proton antiporter [Gammaproteobacteria bacterium]|nr:cation:proton antiporter [Gammaproteobacteria bacterium]
MDLLSIAMVAGGLLLYSLVSGRLQGTIVSAPLVFILFGWALGSGGFDLATVDIDHSAIHVVAELTLILVLFSDAARIDLARVRRDHRLPVRMLLIGLPLTIAAGALVAAWLFPEISPWEAALLAALLAPTDAALGQSVVSDEAVPIRIRQAINIESGLNDGIVLPAVLLLAALAGVESGAAEANDWIRFGLLQVTLGPLAGVVIGFLGARLLDTAVEKGWVNESFQGIGILSLAMFIFVVAELIGGNGFIAAFVGGMTFGNSIRNPCTFLFEFMETEGQLLMLITFLIFGIALLPDGIAHVTPSVVFYAALSLTVIRMIPIMISLLGERMQLPTQLFLGWFGPRGLASILFVLLILDESELPHREELLSVTVVTVALSALLHGITAAPLSKYYGRLVARMGECEETEPACEIPLRSGPADAESATNRMLVK